MSILLNLLPLLIVTTLVIVFAIIARFARIYPNRSLVYFIAVPTLMSISLVFITGPMLIVVLVSDVVIVSIALLDLCGLLAILATDSEAPPSEATSSEATSSEATSSEATPSKNRISVEREVGRVASLGKTHRVTLTLTNRSKTPRSLLLRDDVPPTLRPEPDEFVVQLKANSRTTVHYDLRPQQRGAFQLEKIYIRSHSTLKLWQRLQEFPLRSTIHVYPDMKQLSQYAVLARTNRLSLMGVRRTRKIGQDNEFERMRDYTPDDNYKHIDWRTTARRNKLTVKDYQANQSQRIIFMLDCGRMMTNETADGSLLDHALNAMLMMSYVALKQGDSVGMLAFSDQVHQFVPPRGGMNQMNKLLHASFDQLPRLVESRYDQAFLYLAAHCRKRALVVLISNVIDEVNAHQIEQYLGNLVGRHLPLGVLLRDRHLFDPVDISGPTGTDLYQAAAAADILSWRNQVLSDLESRGVLALDVFPEDITAPLVNRYLDIKARHLL